MLGVEGKIIPRLRPVLLQRQSCASLSFFAPCRKLLRIVYGPHVSVAASCNGNIALSLRIAYAVTGKVNLALVKACQLCCPFLVPLNFNKAFYGVAIFGLILNESSKDAAALADKIPSMMENAQEVIQARQALLRKPGGWKKALGSKPVWL